MAITTRPGLDRLATTASGGGPGPLMKVPREIRDIIYRFLLSTKHTRIRQSEPAVDSLRYKYTYRFHTAILFTNKQVYHEASDIFYMENLFIRVNMASTAISLQRPMCRFWGDNNNALSIRADVSKVRACTRHVMEIDVIPNSSSSSSQRRDYHLMLACDNLPDFCREYLCMGERSELRRELTWEDTTGLWIIIGDEVANPPENGEPAAIFNAATRNAAAHRKGLTKDSGSAVEWKAIIDEEANGWETLVNGIGLTPRLRRLLEPLRVLHSVEFSYIDAPISEQYREAMHASLLRVRPAIHDQYSMLFSAYEEALETFTAGFFASAIHKLRGTFDIWRDADNVDGYDAFTRLATGPFAGMLFKDALLRMYHSISMSLARAYLKFPKDVQCVRAAQDLARRAHIIVRRGSEAYGPGSWDGGAHEAAMRFYLQAEIWEARDGLGEHDGGPRSEALRDVTRLLMRALRYEPTNPTLRQELMRRLKEKAAAEKMEQEMKGRSTTALIYENLAWVLLINLMLFSVILALTGAGSFLRGSLPQTSV